MSKATRDCAGERSHSRESSSAPEILEAAHEALERWRGWPRIEALLAKRAEMKLFFAGGGLRDVLLEGSPPSKDLDFFLEERYLDTVLDELAAHGRIEHTIFGSPQWYPRGEERMFCDLIAIERFHNGLGRCREIVDVLGQCDFTANAMALEMRSGCFFDPAGGASDLRRRVMRAVRLDFPDEPVVPGHDLTRPQVLWFRIVHYTALLGLEIEPVTLRWLRERRGDRRKVERYEEVFHRLHPETRTVLERYELG